MPYIAGNWVDNPTNTPDTPPPQQQGLGQRLRYGFSDKMADANNALADWNANQINNATQKGFAGRAQRLTDRSLFRHNKANEWQANADRIAAEEPVGLGTSNRPVKDWWNEKASPWLQEKNPTGNLAAADAVRDWRDNLYKAPTDTVFNQNMNDIYAGNSGIGGRFYQGAENQALGTMSDQQNMNMGQLGSEVLGMQGALNQQNMDDPLQRAIKEQNIAAATGQLTSPDSQYFQTQNRLMDRIAQEERAKMNNSLGAQNLMGGSMARQSEEDFTNKLILQKQNMLAGLQSQSAKDAMNYALQDKGLNNSIMQIAANMSQFKNQSQAQAAGNILNYMGTVANTLTSQAQLRLSEREQNIQANMGEAQSQADFSKWVNEFNEQVKNDKKGMFTNFIKTIMMLGTGGI